MLKIISATSILLFLIFSVSSCSTNSTANSKSISISEFNQDELKGRYQLEIREALEEEVAIDSTDDGWEKLGKGLVKMAIQNLNIQFEFLEAGKGNIYIDGGIIDFFQAFSDEPAEVEPKEFEYSIKNDSFIFFKDESGKFKPAGILSYCNKSYDSIRIHRNTDSVNYNLLLVKR